MTKFFMEEKIVPRINVRGILFLYDCSLYL